MFCLFVVLVGSDEQDHWSSRHATQPHHRAGAEGSQILHQDGENLGTQKESRWKEGKSAINQVSLIKLATPVLSSAFTVSFLFV